MESKRTKQISGWIAGILLMVGIMIFAPVKAQAANPQLVTIKPNITYTKYDADGDRKADRIKLNVVKNKYGFIQSYNINVNGKKMVGMNFTNESVSIVNGQLCTLSNGKVYFFVESQGDSIMEIFAKLYQIKGTKMVQVANLRSILGNNFSDYLYKYYSRVNRVKGNTIYFRYYTLNYSTGGLAFDVPWSYRNGKLVSTTNTFNTRKDGNWGYTQLTMARQIAAYTTVKQNKKSFTLDKGEKVKVNKVYIKAKTFYVCITRSNGKSGWVKGVKRRRGDELNFLFKESAIAG